MKKYTVTLEETVHYQVQVEANNRLEAEDLAEELWQSSADPNNDFCGSSFGAEAVNCEVLKP